MRVLLRLRNYKKVILALAFFVSANYLVPMFSNGLEPEYSSSKFFVDSNDRLLYFSLSEDDKYRSWTKLESIPEKIQKSFIVKEDQYFKYHYGFNPFSLVQAAFKTYIFKSGKYGASTITMQLARIHYGINTKSIKGKLLQIIAASWLEFKFSKTQILEGYLNLAPFGRNIEGIRAASTIYFDKTLDKLNDLEILFLTNVPQSPGGLSSLDRPSNIPKKYLDNMRVHAQKLNLDINEKEMNELRISSVRNLPFKAPHLVMRFKNLDSSKLSIDLEIQQKFEKTIHSYLLKHQLQNVDNASAILVDTRDMKVLSYVGSGDFFSHDIQGQNDGVISKRSPGSTLKPFVYAMAMEQGIIHPGSILYDAPLVFRTPENYDHQFLGPMSATQALIKSRNVPAVYLNTQLKGPSFFSFLQDAGVIESGTKNIYGSSIVLGGVEVSMEQLVSLYAALNNKGEFSKLRYFHNDKGKAKKILSEQASAMVLSMLSQKDRPDEENAYRFFKNNLDVAWKTGTSIGFRDAWSVGVFGPYALAVWVGNFDGSASPYFIGGQIAGPLFFELVDKVKPYIPNNYNNPHYAQDVESVEVCAQSGKIPNQHCPHRTRVDFWVGVSPIHKCEVHKEISIARSTGLRACNETRGEIIKKTYEVWPSDIHEIYRSLKFPHKAPPAYGKECSPDQRMYSFSSPKILSPKSGMSYTLRIADEEQEIHFQAAASTEVKKLYWYLNNQYLGDSKPGQGLTHKVKAGEYTVQVVDDRGEFSNRNLKIKLVK